jgi:hypothetical protein
MATNDIYEIVLRGHLGTVGAVYNVFHVRDEGGSGDIASVPQGILDTYTANFLSRLPSALTFPEATYAKISPAPAGPQISVATTKAGTDGEEYVPNCAYVVKWITATGGRSGRGRTYFGPIPEDRMVNGVLATVSQAYIQEGADALVAAYGVGGSESGDFVFGVWSRKLGLFYPITAAAARANVYSMRTRSVGRGI